MIGIWMPILVTDKSQLAKTVARVTYGKIGEVVIYLKFLFDLIYFKMLNKNKSLYIPVYLKENNNNNSTNCIKSREIYVA